MKIVQPSPIAQADTYFIDGSSNSKRSIHVPDIHQYINTTFSLAQHVELTILVHLFWVVHKPLNII